MRRSAVKNGHKSRPTFRATLGDSRATPCSCPGPAAAPAPVFASLRFCSDFSRKINNLRPPLLLHPDAVSYLRSHPPDERRTNLTSSWHFRNKIVIKHIGHVISFVCGILLPFFRAILNCYKCDGRWPGPVCLLSSQPTPRRPYFAYLYIYDVENILRARGGRQNR